MKGCKQSPGYKTLLSMPCTISMTIGLELRLLARLPSAPLNPPVCVVWPLCIRCPCHCAAAGQPSAAHRIAPQRLACTALCTELHSWGTIRGEGTERLDDSATAPLTPNRLPLRVSARCLPAVCSPSPHPSSRSHAVLSPPRRHERSSKASRAESDCGSHRHADRRLRRRLGARRHASRATLPRCSHADAGECDCCSNVGCACKERAWNVDARRTQEADQESVDQSQWPR